MSDFATLVKVPVQGSGSNEYGKPRPQGVLPWRRRDPRLWLGILACAVITPVCAVVTPPVFLPSDADSVGKFNVQVTASPGTTIRYTLTGAEPTQYDRTITSGSSIVVDRTMTLKAKAWSGSESSATTSTLLKVTGQVDGGSETLLALKTNGKLFGWGNQDYGRLSNGSSAGTNVMSPIALVPASGGTVGTATRVAAGSRHTLYLDASGKVYASGRNGSGECGRPGNTSSEILNANNVLNSSTTTDHLASCVDVAAGLDFSMALTSAGKVMTWGSQTSGRLASGSTSGSRNNAAVAKVSAGTSPIGDLTGIVQIAAGKDFALAREANPSENASGTGQVWLWGEGMSNCLTTGNTNDVSWATKAKLDNLTNPTSYLNYALDMDASDLHAAVVRWKANTTDLQGTVWTMGSRADGRIGDNGLVTGTQVYPKKVVMQNGNALIDITQVATGPSHTLALDKNGKVWAWGSNANGALGDNDTTGARNYAAPVRNGNDTNDLTNIVWVGAGGGLGNTAGYSLAIAGDGKVYIWGSNPNGVFGNGTLTPTSTNFPREIPSFSITPGFPTITLNTQVTSANAPGAATITAAVTDPEGTNTIQKVDFYLQGGTPIQTSNPWSIYPSNLAQGSYHAYAIVRDTDGNETASLPTTFDVGPTLDTDSDGLLDSWEMTHFGNLNQTGSGDSDGDKVTNLQEHTQGSNPTTAADANADGIPDDWVAWQLSLPGGVTATTLAPNADPDQDELTNLVEYQLNTKARHFDSDGDGQSDWQEVSQATDPNNASSLAAPLEVSAYQGASGPTLPLSLTNPVTSLGYNLTLSGNVPTGAGYLMTSSNVAGGPAYEWIDISTTGEHLTDFDSDRYSLVEKPIPFGFSLYGTSYSNLFVSGYGFITMINPGEGGDGYPLTFRAPLPNVDGHMSLIAPYEQYLEPDEQGAIYYQAFSDKVVVQWEQVKVSYTQAVVLVSFQAVIYPDGSIRFNYKSIPPAPGNLNIVGYLAGIQNATGTDGIGASWHTGGVQQGLQIHNLDPLSIRFAHPVGTPWVTTSTGTVNGNPLGWNLLFDSDELALGLHEATMKIGKAGGPILYSRPIKLTISENPDVDGDGLPNTWETTYGFNPNDNGSVNPVNGPLGDPDGDKVTNLQEYLQGTNPTVSTDANADGIPDHWVTWQLSLPGGVTASSLAPNADPDQDELTNLVEFQRNTKARHIDSDGDGQSDWQEVAQNTDPNSASSKVAALQVVGYQAMADLVVPQTLANPVPALGYDVSLTGNGGASPWVTASVANANGNPLSWNLVFKGAGLPLGVKTGTFELRKATGPVLYTRTIEFTVAQDPDTDGDGMSDPWEILHGFNPNDNGSGNPAQGPLGDPDGDKVTNLQEYLLGTNPTVAADANADGLPDDWVAWQLSLPGGVAASSLAPNGDPDQDELTNLVEYQLNTKARHFDSDGDGQSDWQEVAQQTNPNNAGSLGEALEVTGYPGTTGLIVPHSLENPVPALGYELSLTGNGGANLWMTASAATVSGDPLEWNLEFNATGVAPGLLTATQEIRKSGGPVLYARTIEFTVIPWSTSGNDVIQGTAGNDDIDGGAGNDTITGGAGDDKLAGGDGKDVYHYNIGDGNDVLTDFAGMHQADDATADYSDLYFGDGIQPGMLLSSYHEADAENPTGRIRFTLQHPAGGSVSITYWDISSGSTGVPSRRRWRFHFTDGTVWGGELFWKTPLFSYPFTGFTGGNGNDVIVGSGGYDSMRGLAGDDLLQGGNGWDSYHYEWGSGNDTVEDTPGNGQLTLVYIFGEAFHDRLTFDFVAPDSLRVNVRHPSDPAKDGSVLLKEWYRTNPVVAKDNWRLYAQNGSGGWSELSAFMKEMTTNGPDTFNLVFRHFSAGQTFSAGAGDDKIYGSSYAETIYGEDGDDTLLGYGGNDTLNGGAGNDLLEGEAGQDDIQGGTGNDTLKGGDGDDVLTGGAGNDVLEGGAGGDVYHWAPGDGDDEILDSAAVTGTYDPATSVPVVSRLVFGAGVEPADIAMVVDGSDLVLQVKDSGGLVIGSVKLSAWYDSWNSTGWRIEFEGGVVWDGRTLVTPGDDHLFGTGGNDSMAGGAGSDTLKGLAGDDVIRGGPGADVLLGGEGNDTYQWHLGDGADVIDDGAVSGAGGRNRLEFGPGIALANLRFAYVDGDSARLDVLDGSEDVLGSVTVTGWFDGRSRSWLVAFDGGVVFDPAMMSTPLGDDLVGTPAADILNGGGGDDVIMGMEGDDVIIGGTGDDVLLGHLGSDTYHWNIGDGHDVISDNGLLVPWAEELATEPEAPLEPTRLIFGPGINPANVSMVAEDWNLIFQVRDDQGNLIGSVTFDNWYSGFEEYGAFVFNGVPTGWGYAGGELIEFADGTIWNSRNLVTPGRDWMIGSAANDTLSGGAGSDRLVGRAGDDVLEGGPGNDRLVGGVGRDTYVWRAGDGLDWIDTYLPGETDEKDIISFPDHVLSEMLIVRVDGNAMYEIRSVADPSQGVRFANENTEIHFGDGTEVRVQDPATLEGHYHSLSVQLPQAKYLQTMEDPDGDLVPNRIEQAFGTDPFDAEDFPQPDAVVTSDATPDTFATIAAAAAHADDVRGDRSIAWIKLEAGTYSERLLLAGDGYFLDGALGGEVRINLPAASLAHSITGDNIVVHGITFGNGVSDDAWELRSADMQAGILFDTCLFLGKVNGSGGSRSLRKVISGRTDFDHCTLLNWDGAHVEPEARLVASNSVIDYALDVNSADVADVLLSNSFHSFANPYEQDWFTGGRTQLGVNPQGYLRWDGQLADKAIHYTQPGNRLDLFGQTRDERRDPGCSEFVNTDNDALPDHWEQRFLGGLGGNYYDDPDSDGVTNLYEFMLGLDPGVADNSGDLDNDGLTDQWEGDHFDHLTWARPGDDPDGDGLTNLQEQAAGTNPKSKDSDGDGLPDAWEIANGTQPNVDDADADADGDGINNLAEFRAGLMANDSDSDNDGINDGAEDTDGDGLSNLQEVQAGTFLHKADSDGDGAVDGWEVLHGFNPKTTNDFSVDSDFDGLSDLIESRLGLNPFDSDSDDDGIPDNVDQDDHDSDGLPDLWEARYFDTPAKCVPGEDPDHDGLTNLAEFTLGTNPNNIDTDGDSLPDGYEGTKASLDPLVANEDYEDEDGDGLGCRAEFSQGTDPELADTDGDSILDGVEVASGSDPEDAGSKPFNALDYRGPDLSDSGIPYIGQLDGFILDEDPDKFTAGGYFGDNSGSASERWALNFIKESNPGGNRKKAINRLFGSIDPFKFKLSPDQIWRVELEHWDHDDASSGFDTLLEGGGFSAAMGYKPDYDYDAVMMANGFLECFDPAQTPLFGQYGNSIQGGWNTRRSYLVPIASVGYSASYSGGDAVGPRYRKIALNGRPMPDSPPEGEGESGVGDEETYVDAFDLSLHHDNSFAHLSVAASDLVIEANASLQETMWTDRGGLRPHEVLTAPFGVSWTSNVCAYLEMVETLGDSESDPITVNVVDQGGRSQRFGTMDRETFFPWPSTRVDKKTYLNTLEKDENGNFVMRKKFGEKLIFKPSDAWFLYRTDRTKPGSEARKHVYWRLDEVEDGFGNKLKYYYGTSSISLIPERIQALGRGNGEQQILISRSTDGRRVESVTDAVGNVTQFHYVTSTVQQPNSSITYPVTKLDYIEYDDGGKVYYTYDIVSDKEVVNDEATWHFHCNVASIKNQLNKVHTFEYQFDRTKQYYSGQFGRAAFAKDIDILPPAVQEDANRKLRMMNAAGEVQPPDSYKTQYGLPRLLKKITLPGNNGFSEFWKSQGTKTSYGPKFRANSGTEVRDALGRKVRYSFEGIKGEIVDHDVEGSGFRKVSMDWMIYYQTMVINYPTTLTGEPGGITERFEFDLDSGLNLKSATDIAGNKTTWHFDDPAPIDPDDLRPKLKHAPNFMIAWSDTTSKVDALGRVESYQYNANRLMTSQTDVNGTVTTYTVDALGRRTKMVVEDPNGKLTEEHYEYANAGFPAFMTRSTRKAFANVSGAAWEQDLVTDFVPDAFGRVYKEISDPGGLALETTNTYDANNNKLTSADANGNITTFQYDEMNRVEKVINADDTFNTTTYDLAGEKTVETDENGHATTYVRDDLGRTVLVSQGDGQIEIGRAYNKAGLLIEEVDPRGTATVTTYDSLYRPITVVRDEVTETMEYGEGAGGGLVAPAKPTKITSPGSIKTFEFDQLHRPTVTAVDYGNGIATTTVEYDGLVTTTTDPLGRVTTNTGDGAGRSIHSVSGAKTATTTYSSTGLPFLTIDPMGRETRMEYDSTGRPVKTRKPDPVTGLAAGAGSPMTETIYDDNGNVIAEVDPLGRRTDHDYDNRNRRWRSRAPQVTSSDTSGTGRATSLMEYDNVGNVISSTAPGGLVTETEYDFADRPIATTVDPGGRNITSSSELDPGGLVLVATDGNGNQTVNTYDALGRLITTTTDPGTGTPIVVTNEYDAAGNLVAVIDGKSQRTEFTYDGLGRKLSTIWDPGTATERVETSQYDDLNLVSQVDAMGRTATYSYDGDHRLMGVAYTGSPGASAQNRIYTYDAGDRVLSVTHPNAPDALQDTAFTYDLSDRLTSETSVGKTHSYPQYDLVGNRLQTVYGGSGTTLVSTYDTLNRLITCNEGGRITSYGYDMAGRTTLKFLPNGNSTTTAFDLVGRTLSIIERDQSSAVISAFDYSQPGSYDAVGNVLRCAETYSMPGMVDRVVVNTYDDCYRLLTETITPDGGAATVTTYAYDAANNRTTKTTGGITTEYVYGNGTNGANSNQLMSYGPSGQAATHSFTYDPNGNRATSTTAAGTDTLGWDCSDRLVSLTKAGGDTYAYRYDYRTRRVTRDESGAGGVNTLVSFSGGSSVQEWGTSGVQAEFVRGSDWGGGVGGVLYSVRSGQYSYNAYNSRGDVVSTSDSSGAASWQATYEAFGTRTTEEGTNTERQRANTKDEDPTGLLNEGFRYRDLESGVFISRDPAGFVDGPNVYTYVSQNPWTYYDAEGLWFTEWMKKQGEKYGSNPVVDAMAPHAGKVIGGTQAVLTVASFVPVLGKLADGLSAGISAAEGNYGEAAMTAAGGGYFKLGRLAGKVAKLFNAADAVGDAAKVAKQGVNLAENVLTVVRKGGDEMASVAGKSARTTAARASSSAGSVGFTKNPWSFITGAPTKSLPEARSAFYQVARSDAFAAKAGFSRVGAANRAEYAGFLRNLRSASFRRSNALQGGFAGMDKGTGQIIMGISRGNLNSRFALSHELIHLTRHSKGITPFQAEDGMRGIRRYRAWIEEAKTYGHQLFGPP